MIDVVTSSLSTAIVSAVAGGAAVLSSAITGTLTYWAGKRQASTAKDISVEDRQQQRIRDAYVTIQRFVKNRGEIAQWWSAAHVTGYHGTPPPELGIESEAEAVAALMASPEVVALVERFNVDLMNLVRAIANLGAARSGPGGRNEELARAAGAEIRKAAAKVAVAAEKVHLQMRLELVGDATIPGRLLASQAESDRALPSTTAAMPLAP